MRSMLLDWLLATTAILTTTVAIAISQLPKPTLAPLGNETLVPNNITIRDPDDKGNGNLLGLWISLPILFVLVGIALVCKGKKD